MTNPPQHPGQPGWRGRGAPPPDPATRRIPRPGGPEAPTEQIRARGPARPGPTPPGPIPQGPNPQGTTPQGPIPQGPGPTQKFPKPPSPADHSPTQQIRRPPPGPPPAPPAATAIPDGKPKRARSRQTILLIALIVVALLAGGLAGGELFARNRADGILSGVAECVVEDDASVSFGVNPPFLWQYLTGDYTNITVTTAGDRVQSANGMTAEVTLADVRLANTADAKGTIGSLQATLSWKSAGIKDTIVQNLPQVGSLLTGVVTNPQEGTIVLQAGENSVTAKPVVAGGDLTLQVLDVVGPLPKDFVQSQLNDLTKKLNDNYPLGIRADSVEVTAIGVVGTFSSRDAAIPQEDQNPCFAGL